MKIFTCQNCGQLVHFENVSCMRCGMPLGFLPDSQTLSAMNQELDGSVSALGGDGARWRACGNAAVIGCNWLVRVENEDAFCPACRLNDTIPDLDVAGNLEGWTAIEVAKRRMIYSLLRLGLPLVDPSNGVPLRFKFLADVPGEDPVLTGHDEGLITLNIAEADSTERERRRASLGEPYRTLLGHMRHEVGHYYEDVLALHAGYTDACRKVFGDDSVDYGEALQRHYETGAPADWQNNYVSAYATMHPFEDFAETWTHYLHIIDTLDTAATFGMAIDPAITDEPRTSAVIGFDPYAAQDMDQLVEAWVPLTIALNSLNRSMGQPDLYPYALNPPVVEKLRFIHQLVKQGALVPA